MNLSLAFVKNESQVLFQSFKEEGSKAQIFDLEDLSEHTPQTILVPESLSQSSEVQEKLAKTSRYAPIKILKSQTIDSEAFDKITFDEALNMTKEIYQTWSLKKNLNLIENMFEYLEQLQNLFPNDRTAYFEELWHILRSNLAATEMTLVYNHMKKAEKEGEKNKLIRVVIEGQSKPNPTENTELGDALFKNYEGKFNHPLELYSRNEETGEIVFLAKVKESPVIIMAKNFECTALQLAALNCLFEGLNR
ncbi:MAG: hypothetical protein NXH75_02900 [Halobacteriovoraceae bacterium]|nr:hypothetical protein [Halobacteriovoraceae bacterium]